MVLYATLGQFHATTSSAAEVCHFDGTTDYAGHVSVVTTAAAADNTTRVDVALRFAAISPFWLPLNYLVEETSQWRNRALLHLDANTRYILAGRVVRQQWDDFQAVPAGLQASRIEGKTERQFRQQFPRFARHWDQSAFGLDWTSDYASAAPVRRPDLDLARLPQTPSVQTPFAFAFYWVRFLQPGTHQTQIFLPGFKADKLADITLTSGAAANAHLWQAELHHTYLSAAPPSTASAQISADGHLQLLTFELHGSAGSARGILHQTGCSGSP